MQGDEVALGEQLVGRDEFHAVKRGGVVGVSEHFHAERTGDDGDCLAYLAEADYAESFAVKPGEGLLISAGIRVPITDDFPKGPLYDLWNTKPAEVAEREMRRAAREAKE